MKRYTPFVQEITNPVFLGFGGLFHEQIEPTLMLGRFAWIILPCAQYRTQGNPRMNRVMDLSLRIQCSNHPMDLVQFLGGDQVGFVGQNYIGKVDLNRQ